MGRTWRAIVADDNPAPLRIVMRPMSSIPGVEVVGQAALDAGVLLRPDLVLMDLAMPGMDGLEATRRLASRPDAPAVILMTVHDLPHDRDAARATGARRFVPKGDLVGLLAPAIEALEPAARDDGGTVP